MGLSENYQPVQNGWNEQNHANSQQRQEFKAEFHQEWGSVLQRQDFFKGKAMKLNSTLLNLYIEGEQKKVHKCF